MKRLLGDHLPEAVRNLRVNDSFQLDPSRGGLALPDRIDE